MKTPLPSKENHSENHSATRKRKFKLTERQRRTCQALLRCEALWREDVDRIAGASNGPEVMRQLKNKGLTWQCVRVKKIDQDGKPCEPGLYSLVGNGRDTLLAWGIEL